MNEQNRANLYADWATEFSFERHRGVHDHGHEWIAFGNDGYGSDDRPIREVAYLRQWMAEHRVEELGFGVSSDECSWALLCRRTDESVTADQFQRALWDAWQRACDCVRAI